MPQSVKFIKPSQIQLDKKNTTPKKTKLELIDDDSPLWEKDGMETDSISMSKFNRNLANLKK